MPRLRHLLLPALLALLCGCAYRLGSNLPEGRRDIALPVFENATDIPEAGAWATRALADEMIRNGAFRPCPLGREKVRLLGTVKRGTWRSVRYDRNRNLETSEYLLRLTLELTAVDAQTGKVLIDRQTVSGQTSFNTRYDLQTSRQDALPRAAADLAKNAHEFLLHALGDR
ncbi:MAG: hypothetical protein ACI4QD_07400 [Kiritimatiellia bacterium]